LELKETLNPNLSQILNDLLTLDSVFKKNPMDPKEGRRYRHMVLEKGGSQEEMKTLTDFLGRAPSTEAFYKELGLKAK
jgi:metallopeptidase MepB